MNCQHCGKLNDPASRFCIHCGQALTNQPPVTSPAFCPHCGRGVPGNADFCPACGQSLTADARPFIPAVPVTPPAMDFALWRRRLPALGSGLVLWCFFLPWILVSCNSSLGGTAGIPMSGYELAMGDIAAMRNLQQGFGSLLGGTNSGASAPARQSGGQPLMWIVPALALLGLFALSGRPSGAATAAIAGVAGIVALVVFSLYITNSGQDLGRQSMRIEFREGYWGSWLGFVWLLLAGATAPKEAPRAMSQSRISTG